MTQKLGEDMSSMDMSESVAGLQEGLQSSLMTSVENIDLTDVGVLMNQKSVKQCLLWICLKLMPDFKRDCRVL